MAFLSNFLECNQTDMLRILLSSSSFESYVRKKHIINRGIVMSNIRLKIHFIIESYWVIMVNKKNK